MKEISESYWWITKVPETLSEAKERIENSDKEKMRSTALKAIGCLAQRWNMAV